MISVLLLRNESKLTEEAAIRLGREMPGIIAAACDDDGPHAPIVADEVTVSMVTARDAEGEAPLRLQILMFPRALCGNQVRSFILSRIRALNLIKGELNEGSIRFSPS